MKKIILFLLLISFIGTVKAQNIQFLGGSNPDKQFVNFVTIELFKPLEHGNLYYFTDFKISKDGFSEAYTEISKYWNIRKLGSLTAQYNAGLNKNFQIKPVYLVGISKAYTNKNFNISIDLLYRYQKEIDIRPGGLSFPDYSWERQHGVQTTVIFCQDLKNIQLSGYCDIWAGDHNMFYIFEPQGWWKFSKTIYAGLEWRVSNYYLLEDYENYFMLGLKWNLEN